MFDLFIASNIYTQEVQVIFNKEMEFINFHSLQSVNLYSNSLAEKDWNCLKNGLFIKDLNQLSVFA